MRRVFIWLSGADLTILRNCTNLSGSERIRFAGLGTLVLVPAILGSLAMAYALSLMTPYPPMYVFGGLVWGTIVLFIDRYIVSTLHKSVLRHWFGTTSSVLLRLLFALVIGTAVAHPLVLLWFKDSITQNIAEHRREAVASRVDQAKRDAEAVPKVESKASPLEQQRAERVARLDCLNELQTYEQSSAASHTSACGTTSGSVSCGPRCAKIGDQAAQVRGEIVNLDEKLNVARAADAEAERRRQEDIAAIEKRAQGDVDDIEGKYSDDYLARVAALAELEERDRQVLWVSLFMIGLFVFVDIMPLMMKIATPMGEYERVRDTAVLRSIQAEDAKREAIPHIERALAQLYLDSERLMIEITMLTKVSVDVIEAWQDHRAAVDEQVRLVRQRTRRHKQAEAEAEARILDMQTIDQQAWQSVMDRTLAFVSR